MTKSRFQRFNRATVLGAGTMGARIAAHLANAGVDVLLLDMPPREGDNRNAVAEAGLKAALKGKPANFFTKELSSRITIGNFEDDLSKVADADWIIEAIVENLDIKRCLFKKVEGFLKPDAVVTTNTSGIPIHAIAEGFSDSFRRCFLGTHFFNPPRYMHLLEVIPGPDTDPSVIERVAGFSDVSLGKGIVRCKDTPNFIANRLGVFGAMRSLHATLEEGLTFSEVDRITGPLTGRPKSATYRTSDLVGLDILVHVAKNLYEAATDDERRDVFVPPPFVSRMMEEKRLGDKTGGGFYKKIKNAEGKSEILELDPESFEYKPRQRVKLPAVEMASQMEGLKKRLRALVFGKDKVASYLQKTMIETLVYAANRMPEISDSIVDVDRAMVWGFGWKKGPFETWDLLGVKKTVPIIEKLDLPVPKLVENLLSSGHESFYEREAGKRSYFDLKKAMTEEAPRAGVIALRSAKEAGKVVKENAGASLIDLGDGALGLEFHSKMNAIGADIVGMIQAGLKLLDSDFDAMVLANDGSNFCVGANLMLLLLEAQEGNFEDIDLMVRGFQRATMGLKTAPKPVVVAPFGMALGGGAEVVLHGAAVQAAAETYIGLVEVGVGLIPAGGGTKELLLRMVDRAPGGTDAELFRFVRQAFETIGMAKVATSAEEARGLGFLRRGDGISMNRDRLTHDAKELALSMAHRGYRPTAPRQKVPVLGESALATFKLGLRQMKLGGYISDHDELIGLKVATILCGGAMSSGGFVSCQRLLDLEREAFLSLCGERKSLERIQHMLKKGKPLRN